MRSETSALVVKKALLLHGWEGYPENNWFPWLKKELEQQGYEVHIPALSNSDYPVLEEQLDDIANINLSSGDIIIGHSLGCQLAMQTIVRRELTGVNVILVAPVYPNMADELGTEKYGDAYHHLFTYKNEHNDFRNINKLENRFTILLSNDDPFINEYAAQEYYQPLQNLEILSLEGKGHFNTTAGILELPEILKYIK